MTTRTEADTAGAAPDAAMAQPTTPAAEERGPAALLLLSVFVIAVCGLIYELLAGTLSAYLLGSSVTQFSLVIGLFLTAMGVGSFLSRFIKTDLIRTFLLVEVLIGLIGGSTAFLLFLAFATIGSYVLLLVVTSVIVGALVGLEIPLIVRIVRGHFSLRTAIGNVLAIDYIGALAASLLFPLLLVPHLGLVRTGFLFGLFNVGVALVGARVFRATLGPKRRTIAISALLAAALLAGGLASASRATAWLEDLLYDDEIIYAKSTPYQRVVLTHWRGDFRLFIDGNIQFSSEDEFRYHEALVHPAMSLVRRPERILLLGAGDGMAAREILKHPSVRSIHLVDLDPEITRIFSRMAPLVRLNKGSLKDPRVKIFNEDAQKYLERTKATYDVVIVDLPDPNNESLGKLYSRSFYRLLSKHLAPDAVMVTQSTSPFYATAAFWCIRNTIAAADRFSGGPRFFTLPYHAYVPAFGDWGFVLASFRKLDPRRIKLGVKTRYLTPELLPTLFVFPKDIGPRRTPINRLDNQILIRLYEEGYRHYNQ